MIRGRSEIWVKLRPFAVTLTLYIFPNFHRSTFLGQPPGFGSGIMSLGNSNCALVRLLGYPVTSSDRQIGYLLSIRS